MLYPAADMLILLLTVLSAIYAAPMSSYVEAATIAKVASVSERSIIPFHPISAGYNSPDHVKTKLGRRTESPGGLFGDNGIPDLADIEQTSIPDCGLIAVLGALVGLNSDWINGVLSYSGDAASITSLTVKLHQPGTLEPKPQTVYKYALTDVRSDAHEGWWVGGIEQAIRQTGRDVSIHPSEALEMLTGRRARYYFTSTNSNPDDGALSKEVAWAFIKANAEQTPVILQSFVEARYLQGRHAFWIKSVRTEGGGRMIYLWNPYGEDEVYDFDVIWTDCYAIYSFSPDS